MDLCALPTVNNVNCEHGQSFALCNRCKGKSASKMGTLWLLDSGASLHFTHDFNDFIEYETAKLADRMPVRTASDIVHIEGKGTVLLEHKVNNKLVQTHLYCTSPCNDTADISPLVPIQSQNVTRNLSRFLSTDVNFIFVQFDIIMPVEILSDSCMYGYAINHHCPP
jgi:hypothetical protein